MLKKVVARLAAFSLAAIFVLATPALAQAANGCDVTLANCGTEIVQPGTDPVVADPTTGFTPAPVTCTRTFAGVVEEVPCSSGAGSWSNASSCYYALAPVQDDPPPGTDPLEGGAWYTCAGACTTDPTVIVPCDITQVWLTNPPPGVAALTPGQAAARIINTFQLEGVDIGMAPDEDIPGAKSYVGVPIWMWVENQTPLSYGPYEQTTTLGGVTITATAKVTSVLWNMGDGETVGCGSPGTEYRRGMGVTDSPTCGHRYSQTSEDQPGGRYPVTALSQWEVTWTGGGEEGTVNLTRTSTLTVEIGEIQSVIING